MVVQQVMLISHQTRDTPGRGLESRGLILVLSLDLPALQATLDTVELMASLVLTESLDTLATVGFKGSPVTQARVATGAPGSGGGGGSSYITQNIQSTDYTLVLSDANGQVYHPVSDTTARVFTIPDNSSVAYPIGTTLTFVNALGAGTITISTLTDVMWFAGSGLTGSRALAGAPGVATALKVTSTGWIISGTGLL
jgi:hypothetical protein